MKSKDYFCIDWSSLVYFDETSKSKLRWISNNKECGWRNYKSNKAPNGWRLEYCNQAFYCHKVIAILKLGLTDNNMVINHIDCNPFNNNLDNLEICTTKENARRQKCHIGRGLHPTNTSGITGVYEHKSGSCYYAKAQWSDLNGKICCQYYSYKTYGKIKAWELAKEARNRALIELNIQGAGYALSNYL